MSDERLPVMLAFAACLVVFAGVGLAAILRKSETTADYLLAGRAVNPWLTALSNFATGHSGFGFIGQIGFIYTVGVSGIWLPIGWFIGDYIAWLVVYRPVREQSAERDIETWPGFLTGGRTGPTRRLAAVLTLVFLAVYAAAQLTAGNKALAVAFGWSGTVGVLIGAALVLIYCVGGGIRASIWTDAVQCTLMIGGMLALAVVGVWQTGGLPGLWAALDAIDPALIEVFPAETATMQFGFGGFVLGWVFGGFGVVGQPHIMVRAMVIDDARSIAKARRFHVLMSVVFSATALLVGLSARVMLPGLLDGGDPEMALPLLSFDLLPGIMVGMMLACIFAATVSTADSQILSCSAALTQDLELAGRSYRAAKYGTLAVGAVATAIALVEPANVFGLVTLAWSSLAAGLGPLVLLALMRRPVSEPVGVAMIVAGLGGALGWRLAGWASGFNEVLPGALMALVVYAIAHATRDGSKPSRQ